MTVRYYSSVASEKTLVGTITSGQTTMVVSNTIGLPSLFPYTLAVDYETATEELVEVTNAAGTTLTIVRAIDGTSASSHNAGARVRHVTSARDFSDSRNHENADDGIHGLSPGEEIVGTDKVQTLTNKTLVNAQGSLLNPDINMTGTNTITINRSPAGADTVNIAEVTNGADQTLAFQNNGMVKIRNTVALDSAVTTRRLATLMSDGTTERMYVAASGEVVAIPRSGTATSNGGFKVLDPGDNAARKLLQVRNSADTIDKLVFTSGGGLSVTTSDASTIPLLVKAPVTPATDIMRVTDSADVAVVFIDSGGELNAQRRMDIFNDDLPASPTLQVKAHAAQTVSIQTWETSAGSDRARVRADGSMDSTSQVTSGNAVFTAAAGWSLTSAVANVKGGTATIHVNLLRTGSSITASADGDLTGDPALGTVAAAFRPHTSFGSESLVFLATTPTGSGACVQNASTGDMNMWNFSGNGTIFNGINIRFTMTYPLPFV